MAQVTLAQARAAKQSAARVFSRIGKVAGIGVTRIGDDYAVKVNLSEPLTAGTDAPTEVDGVPIRLEVVGTVRKR